MDHRKSSIVTSINGAAVPDPNDVELITNLDELLNDNKSENNTSGVDGEDMETMKKQDACFRMPIPKKYIGLHSFSRRLYRDVPDLFDMLKKLFFKMQYYVDRLNPEVRVFRPFTLKLH